MKQLGYGAEVPKATSNAHLARREVVTRIGTAYRPVSMSNAVLARCVDLHRLDGSRELCSWIWHVALAKPSSLDRYQDLP